MKNYCPRCGTPFNKNDKNCWQCGHDNPNFIDSVASDVPVEKTIFSSTPEPLRNASLKQDIVNNKTLEEKKASSALITGVIALVLCLTFNMVGLILSIVGLINAIKAKQETPYRRAAITINTIALVLSGIILTFGISLFALSFHELSKFDTNTIKTKKEIPVVGRFNCEDAYNSNNSGEYNTVLYLDNYNRFTIGTYGDLENNKATGTYTYKNLNKTDKSGRYKYYEITLNGYEDSFILDGEVQDHAYETILEFAITENNGKKEGALFFTPSSSLKYCYEK